MSTTQSYQVVIVGGGAGGLGQGGGEQEGGGGQRRDAKGHGTRDSWGMRHGTGPAAPVMAAA